MNCRTHSLSGAPQRRTLATHGLRRLLGCALAIWLVLGPARSGLADDAVELTILHLNDTHGALRPGSVPDLDTQGGLTRAATLIRRLRAEAPGPVLLLHAGDVLSRGGPVTVHHAGAADCAALASLGLDALTPGNGDFYFGPENLLAQTTHARLPVVLGNVVWKAHGTPLFPPAMVVTTGVLRVGIVGVGIIHTKHYATSQLELRNALAVARAEGARLRPTVDLLILLSHSGHKEDLALAALAPDYDLIVGGHSHTVLQTPARVARPAGREGVVVQAGDLCRFVGVVRIRMEPSATGHQPTAITGQLLPVGADLAEDPALVGRLATFEAGLDEPVGRIETTLNRMDLLRRMGEAMRRETGADVAILDTGAIQAGLPQGPVRRADVYRVHPWRNPILTMTVARELLPRLLAREKLVTVGCERVAGADGTDTILVGGKPLPPGAACRVVIGANAAAETPDLRGLPSMATDLRVDELLIRQLERPPPSI